MLNFNDVIWKDIEGFEDRYMVSNTGLIKSVVDNHGKQRNLIITGKRRSMTCTYLYVKLSVKNKTHNVAIHRAVANAFIDNPDNKPMVNHLDGNKLNNNACNLEWATCSENHQHAYKTGLRSSQPRTEKITGVKSGQSSDYHNVSWDSSRNLWKATLKDKGKMLFQKRFKSELEAAIYVNQQLDLLGFTNRPKNIIK